MYGGHVHSSGVRLRVSVPVVATCAANAKATGYGATNEAS